METIYNVTFQYRNETKSVKLAAKEELGSLDCGIFRAIKRHLGIAAKDNNHADILVITYEMDL